MRVRIYRDSEPHKWFEVEGPSRQMCRKIADRECERLGWKLDEVYSEPVENGGLLERVRRIWNLFQAY